MSRPKGSVNKPKDASMPKNEVTVIDNEQPKSVLVDMSNRYGMEPAAFEATVRATCMRPDKNGRIPTREEFAAFLLVAKEYNLNPLTKEIYAYASKGGGIVPIVSVDGWVNLVNSHGQCDGFEFDMEHSADGKLLISCTCRLYRKDRSHPTTITEYYSECVRDTEPWKMKHRMLRHKSLIQAARYAFGFSGIYDEDEGEKIAAIDPNRDAGPPRQVNVLPDEPKQIEATANKPEPEEARDGTPPPRVPHAERKADPISSGPPRTTAPEQVMQAFKDAKEKAEKKAAKKSAPPADMDAPGDMDGDAPSDPESILKAIDAELAAVEDPDQLQSTWDASVEPLLTKLSFPPDLDEAQSLYRKHEKRLEP